MSPHARSEATARHVLKMVFGFLLATGFHLLLLVSLAFAEMCLVSSR